MFPPLLLTSSIIPRNTLSGTESNMLQTAITATAAYGVAGTRIGTATFQPLDAWFVEPTNIYV